MIAQVNELGQHEAPRILLTMTDRYVHVDSPFYPKAFRFHIFL